jgi:glycopeptide antibiotics resistance protein
MTKRNPLILKFAGAVLATSSAIVMYFVFLSDITDRLEIRSDAADLILIFACTVLLYSVFQYLFFRKLYRVETILLSGAYFLSIFAVLFLRNASRSFLLSFPGWFSGGRYTMNPFSFVQYARYDPTTLLTAILNFLLFIPLFLVLRTNSIPARLWAVIVAFFAVEMLQFVLGCGSFDMGDVLLYFLGYLAGIGLYYTSARFRKSDRTIIPPINPSSL